MKNLIGFILVLLLVNISMTAQEKAKVLTGKDIIEKHLEAIGGRENLRLIKDETMVLRSLPEAPSLSMTIMKKAPNKYYQYLSTDSFKQQTLFDGEKGKTIQFGRELYFDAAENARMNDQSNLHLLLDLEELEITIELVEDETINDINCHVVMLYLANDVEWKLYFDKSTFYMVRQIIPIFNDRGKFTQAIDFSDFINFDGYIYPSKIKQLMDPQTITLKVESIEINSEIDDVVFEID